MFYPLFNSPPLNTAFLFSNTPTISFASLAHQAYLEQLSLQVNWQKTLIKNALLAQESSLSNEVQSQSTPYSSPYQSHSLINPPLTTRTSFVSESPDLIKQESKNIDIIESRELQAQVERMLTFFIHTSNKITGDQKLTHKMSLTQGPHQEFLLELFDILEERFEKSFKHRIDMLRLIVRKAISVTKKAIKKKEKLGTGQDALKKMCHRYFEVNLHKKPEEEVKKTLRYYFPYLHDSRNKTANNNFVEEIFASKKFQEDYLLFYMQFPAIWEDEMETRFKKFVEWIMKYVNNPSQIKEFKRLPWLNTCMENTKIIAEELLGKCCKGGTAEILIDDDDDD